MQRSQVNWRRQYPFRSHEMFVGPLRLHYLDEGHQAPLLFVHGNPTWSFYWRNLVTAFRDSHRVVAVDHMGCGLSDKPQDYPYTLAQHTANLIQLVEHLDLHEITLVGHDWGGAIGLGAAIKKPERFAQFVLFNTGAFPPPFVPLRIRICRTPWLGQIAVRGFNLFARAAFRMAIHHPDRRTPMVRAGLLAPYDSWAHRVAIYRFIGDIPLTPRHPTWETLARLESELTRLADRPALLIWGMRDWCFTPRCLERLCQILPHAEVQRLEDAGHYVVEDAHERIVPILLDFLQRHPVKRNTRRREEP